MDLTKQGLFQLMDSRMDYLGQRQRILAQNVSNANTPGYRASDMRHVDFIDALHREMHKIGPSITNEHHLPAVSPSSTFASDPDKRPYETKPDRNGVVMEEQMLKVAGNQLDYQTTTQLYTKYIGMMKTAVSYHGQ